MKKRKGKGIRKRGEIVGIEKETLDFILEVSKSNHPREFIGMLRADGDAGLVTDVLFLPGTLSSDESAIIRLDMMPTGLDYVGSVHSHPSQRHPSQHSHLHPADPAAMRPSEQDLIMFSKTGNCHIITFYPYAAESWKCYNSRGEERALEVVKEKW